MVGRVINGIAVHHRLVVGARVHEHVAAVEATDHRIGAGQFMHVVANLVQLEIASAVADGTGCGFDADLSGPRSGVRRNGERRIGWIGHRRLDRKLKSVASLGWETREKN